MTIAPCAQSAPTAASLGLPLDEPFTLAAAREHGVSAKVLARLVRSGCLRRPVHGVYLASQAADDLAVRARILRLVTPSDAFVCDRTAAWLHGAPAAMAPNEHLLVPQVSCFRPSDSTRLRQGIAISGERSVAPRDLMEVHGVVVTTPLRTAVDLGRLQRTRDLRLAGMDAMAATGAFTHEELLQEVSRFARQRGVVLLRELVVLVDPGAQSAAESALRLRWHDAGLPWPRTQVPVGLDDGLSRYVDMGVEEWLFGAEYDGEEWHSTPEQVVRDAIRRERLRDERGWVIVVFRTDDVYGPRQDADLTLRRQFAAARASYPARVVIL